MHRTLVTGAAGRVGLRVAEALRDAGWDVVRLDLALDGDVRDLAAVRRAMRGCDVVVHAAALAHDTAGTPAQIVETNVLGTWNVLVAAEAEHVSRVIVFSSAQVFGCAEGEGFPEYLPIDDQHPLRAARPYGMSKRLVEEMCTAWTSRVGIPTIVLRPVMILDDADLEVLNASTVEFGAMVHLDDVAAAVVAASTAPVEGTVRAIVCGPGEFDSSVARERLGWRARRTW